VDIAKMFEPSPHVQEAGFLVYSDGLAVGVAMIGNMRYVNEPLPLWAEFGYCPNIETKVSEVHLRI
jgi:hypothetical protein